MKSFQFLLPLAFCAAQSCAAPFENVEHVEKRDISYVVNNHRADAVKDAFLFGWNGYYEYAFPHDELLPVTNGYSDPR